LLLATESNGNTAWQCAAEWGKLDLLQNIWDLAKEILTREEIKNKLLLATDSEGYTAWQRAAFCGKLDVMQEIWDWAKDILKAEEINNLLTTDH
jgi:ankyrin repeat protein